ncbi:MAG TPA: hypothetical protein VLD61_03335 [Methylomirabilota bacterium]|nr:hypothetical protein [Methylomirabilota bacterium]
MTGWRVYARGLLAVGVWVAFAGPALGQERVDGNVYRNPRYGIEIAKPSNWYFITAGTIFDLARKSPGGSRLRSTDDPVKATGFAVVVSKVPALGRAFDPQVILLVYDLPQPPGGLAETCEGLRSGMSDPETVTPTREVPLDGRTAARLDFRGSVDGAAVRATALCALQGQRAFVVVAQALLKDFEGVASVFETILSSFRLK